MSQTLERLIYRSRMTPGLDEDVELDRIFRTSARWNGTNGIVGALACSGQTFVQVLEGRKDRVAELLERLRADPRHSDLRILARWPIVAPMFDDWSMAKADLRSLDARALNMLVKDGTGAQLTGILYDLAAHSRSPRKAWV